MADFCRPAVANPRLAQLIESLREAERNAPAAAQKAEAVAARLQPYLGLPDLLTPDQRQGDPDDYRQHILHVEPDGAFSVVALVWFPGQQTTIHDHVAWCVTGVYEGEEHESRYEVVLTDDGERLALTEEIVNSAGQVSGIAPPGDIHRVRNAGAGIAISIHVYGADITGFGTSIRRTYDEPQLAPLGMSTRIHNRTAR
jgi:3-mercaptopropionate dioxygenase